MKHDLNNKNFERKAKRIYSVFACVALLLVATAVPALAADDPLTVVNNLSDFIFSLIRAIGLILLGFGILQVGLSLKSHDPSQRANGMLTVAGGTDVYFNELTAELVGLIKAASGHALVLFTSYAAMSAVKERLREESLPFPLLTLGRNAPHIIEQFRHTPGAVLLATGAAWEGFDFPGDCVSLLIIPRLPFAYPDARKERELEKYSSLHAFIREVAVPEMQIKLRQGFGRAIRTESDTCVIAILDERACRGRRYAQAVSEALPEMRRTGSLREVTRFLREKKPESYFEVGR